MDKKFSKKELNRDDYKRTEIIASYFRVGSVILPPVIMGLLGVNKFFNKSSDKNRRK